jgi:chromosome segregation ATPase
MEQKIENLEKNLTSLTKEMLELKELIGTGFTKVSNNFSSIKKEIDSLHAKVDILNKKVDSLEGSTTDGFGEVGLKLENLTEEISKISVVTKYDEEFKNLQGLN